MILPTLRAFCTSLDFECVLVTGHGYANLIFDGLPFAQTVEIQFEANEKDPHHFDALQAAREIGPVDVFVSLSSWYTEALGTLKRLLRPSVSLGVCGDFDKIVSRTGSQHMTDQFFETARFFDQSLEISSFLKKIECPEEVKSLPAELLSTLEGRKLLLIHPEPSIHSKRWDNDCFSELIRRVASVHSDIFALSLTRGEPCLDEGLGDSFLQVGGARLPMFIAAVSCADFFIGVDSVGVHLAENLEVPGIALFGATNPEQWGFRKGSVSKNIFGQKGMASISVDEVYEAFVCLRNTVETQRESS